MLVDTNILVDVLENDPEWAAWSVAQLRAQSKIHRLVINPIIYSELSLTFSSVEDLDEVLDGLKLPVLCAVPPKRRREKQCTWGFFYRGACCC
jgi:predicted nucleic acid-binding protein